MTKAPSNTNTPSEGIDYTEEDMSETEEYFQNASPTKDKQTSSNSFESQTPKEQADDGVTIGALPMEKVKVKKNLRTFCLKQSMKPYHLLEIPVKNAVYFHLQNNFKINKNEIPQRIDEFSNIIHKIFGSGAGRLEIKFMKTLNSKINVNIHWPEHDSPLSKWLVIDMSFMEYVQLTRKNYKANFKETEMPDQKTAEIF